MARDENPPFPRGETFYNGTTIDSANLGGQNHEGKLWVFEDVNLSTGVGAKDLRSNRPVLCMCVRNISAIALLPKRLVTLQTGGADGKSYLGRVDGYSRTTAQGPALPVDEWLPAAGVPANDLFWVVVQGPATVLTDIASGANNVITVGMLVVALTGVTSQATTAGHIAPQDLTGATALLGDQVQNRIGRALSAATTANTNSDVLIDVVSWGGW